MSIGDRVHFGVLGELVVRSESGVIAVTGARQRALLTLLLLNGNRTVTSDLLIEQLWPGAPADASVSALKMTVSRLRKAMHVQGARIVTREHGYLARVDDGELDCAEFERELVAGRAAVARGETALALAQLRNALGRWRGPALREFRDQQWARLDALRLEGLRVEALEERIAAELALGQHAAAVAELEELVAEHPERERLHGHLMIALYRSGRQIEALDAFRRARRHLLDEYGIEPGEALRVLHQAILDQAPTVPGADPAGIPAPRSSQRSAPKLTSRLRVQSTMAFVGRAAERRALEQAFADGTGDVRAVLISGEPGIGKTRLVSEFATGTHERGFTVAGGRCDADLGLPYQPFVEVLDDLIDRAPSGVIEQHLQVHGQVLARIAPRLSLAPAQTPTGSPVEGQGAHHRLFAAVGDFLTRLARTGPVVIVLEDLHWADDPTVLLLKHLVTMPGAEQLTVLGTYRSTDLENTPLSGLLPLLHREATVRRIALDGLSDAEVVDFVRAHAHEELGGSGQHEARRLRRDTAGNPFFLAQLLQAREEQSLPASGEPDPRGEDERIVPVSLRETITERIAMLGTRAGALLSAAAVVGDEVELTLLRRVAGVPDDDLIADVEAGISSQLLFDDAGPRGTRIAFVHALVAQVLRSELSAARRRALHRRVATAMESLYGEDGGEHIAALAHHWRRGCEPPDVDSAIRCARLAAQQALERLAPAEAVRWYRDAVELHASMTGATDRDRCELMIRLGRAQREAGDAGFRETLLEAGRIAARSGDGEQLVQAALANTRGFTSATGEIDDERVAMLESALEVLGDGASPQRACLLAARAVELAFCGEPETPHTLSQQALAMVRRTGDDAALAQVLRTRFFAIWTPDTLETRLLESAENVRLCERLGDPLAQAQALHWRANACLESADMAAAQHCIERVGELSDRLREPTVMWQSAYNNANLALALGRLEEAEQLSLSALKLGQGSGQPDALPVFAAQLANLRFYQGRLGELVPLSEQVLAEHPGITGFRAVLALARWELGDRGEARQAVSQDRDREFADVAYDVTWLSVACIYAHVCSRLGDREAAAVLYRMLDPWRDQVAVSVVAWGCVTQYLGMLATTLGDYRTAAADLERATETIERMGAPVWSCQIRLEKARMLAARGHRGDGERSKAAAHDALDAAREIGCETVAREAGALLGPRSPGTTAAAHPPQ